MLTRISRLRPPIIFTCATPGTRDNSGCIFLSTKSYNSCADNLEVTPIDTIGKSERENLLNDGSLASLGKSALIALILRCASLRVLSTFASLVSCTTTTERLSYEYDCIFLIFSKAETASSIFFVTVLSISEGEAPAYTVEIVTTFTSNLGMSS